jgi:hypothetical protein
VGRIGNNGAGSRIRRKKFVADTGFQPTYPARWREIRYGSILPGGALALRLSKYRACPKQARENDTGCIALACAAHRGKRGHRRSLHFISIVVAAKPEVNEHCHAQILSARADCALVTELLNEVDGVERCQCSHIATTRLLAQNPGPVHSSWLRKHSGGQLIIAVAPVTGSGV